MIEAFMLVVVKPGTEEKVYRELKKRKEIKEIYRVYGEYDLLLRLEAPDVHLLDQFHDEVLRRIGNIEMTETLIASSYRG